MPDWKEIAGMLSDYLDRKLPPETCVAMLMPVRGLQRVSTVSTADQTPSERLSHHCTRSVLGALEVFPTVTTTR